jgi:hypothetical protein
MKLKPNRPPGTMEKPATQEVQDLMTARWVADMIGVAAKLELADFIQAGANTAEEIAKAKGLHANSLYRLLRGLASYGIFAEQEDGTFTQTGEHFKPGAMRPSSEFPTPVRFAFPDTSE